MPNNYLSVLHKLIIKVENENVGLKVRGGGHKHTIPPIKKVMAPTIDTPPPPASHASEKLKQSPFLKDFILPRFVRL